MVIYLIHTSMIWQLFRPIHSNLGSLDPLQSRHLFCLSSLLLGFTRSHQANMWGVPLVRGPCKNIPDQRAPSMKAISSHARSLHEHCCFCSLLRFCRLSVNKTYLQQSRKLCLTFNSPQQVFAQTPKLVPLALRVAGGMQLTAQWHIAKAVGPLP